jgi:polar amino acid transport system permease protein
VTTLAVRPDAETAVPPPTGTPYDQLRVVPARHPGRWVATGIVAVLLAMVANSLITNPRWEWDVVGAYLTEESIVRGVWMTIQLTLITAALGFALGTVLALMRLSHSPLLQAVSWGYTWVFRSVPLILQLLLWYNLAYLYQHLDIGIPFGPSFASLETLSLIDKFGPRCWGSGCTRPPTPPRSSAPASSRWTRASWRRRPPSASRAAGRARASCCPRRCGRSCRRRSTR